MFGKRGVGDLKESRPGEVWNSQSRKHMLHQCISYQNNKKTTTTTDISIAKLEMSYLQFSEIIFIDEVTGQKEYFTRRSGGDIRPIDSYNNPAAPQGLWDSHGLADSSYSYQLLICDHAFYSGFHVSGYTNCYKKCGGWCGDKSSPYFRTSATHNWYSGVAFNVNGHHPNVLPKKLVSVGLR